MGESQSKICKKCFETKSIGMFYSHKGMADGYLNICKKCKKKNVQERHRLKSKDPEWLETEKIRGREKYHRLNYKLKICPSEATRKSTKNYREKFPEKIKAQALSRYIECPAAFHKHHWSYLEENAKDVIILPIQSHSALHRFIVYDQERMAYRDSDGILLDRESTLNLLEKIGESEQAILLANK